MEEKEPSVDGPALRKFSDATYKPLCNSLDEIRKGIDGLDEQIVALLAKRAMYVKDAARFKANSFQVSAPARQAQVFAKARILATKHNLGFSGLEDVVEATYRTMVAEFIAAEQRYFHTGLVAVAALNSDNQAINQFSKKSNVQE
jgi:isochorismate pyruvate lyase